ncbi:MAG TPA: heme o synthase [Casimicrobiaceae bacterium]|nr:heme o synthase [Casimicrobiaceae bacterium]
MRRRFALVFDLFKLRIGLVIGFTALAGLAVTPGATLASWRVALLALAVVVSSAAAGAFNQYVERDIDARMARTRARPFVTGRLEASPAWLALIALMCAGSAVVAALATNALAALYTFLGAFVYGVVYTVWLKRRTWLNIVIGGLAGSFAVLAGAAAVAPEHLDAVPLWLAVVLFLWTPPHFWSLAIAYRKDYEAAGVPMLPVVVGDSKAARAILASAVLLVLASIVPAFYGLSWLYLAAAVGGGGCFLVMSAKLVREPCRRTAMANFHASLAQLTLLLTAAIADARLFV